MNILVIGASGRVGGELVEKLLADDHQVTGTSTDNESEFDKPNYTHLKLDLTQEKEALSQQIEGEFDAIYFVAGSGGESVLEIDLHGAVKTMQVAKDKGINRYIMLSTVFSLEPQKWASSSAIEEIKDYYIAKHYADHWLVNNSDLDYTIVQAGALKEREPTGKIDINNENAGENAINDVAETLRAVLEADNTYKQVFNIQNGDTDIKAAVASVR